MPYCVLNPVLLPYIQTATIPPNIQDNMAPTGLYGPAGEKWMTFVDSWDHCGHVSTKKRPLSVFFIVNMVHHCAC